MQKKLVQIRILFVLVFISVGLSPSKAEINMAKDSIVKAADKKEEKSVFQVVEEHPTFPGGAVELRQYFIDNIVYPEALKDSNLVGTVYATVTILKDGSVENPLILKGLNPLLDAEVIRLIASMPAWIPGKQRGRNVDVQFNIPLKFPLMPIEQETPKAEPQKSKTPKTRFFQTLFKKKSN